MNVISTKGSVLQVSPVTKLSSATRTAAHHCRSCFGCRSCRSCHGCGHSRVANKA